MDMETEGEFEVAFIFNLASPQNMAEKEEEEFEALREEGNNLLQDIINHDLNTINSFEC